MIQEESEARDSPSIANAHQNYWENTALDCTGKNVGNKICPFLENEDLLLKMSIFFSNRRIIRRFEKKNAHFEKKILIFEKRTVLLSHYFLQCAQSSQSLLASKIDFTNFPFAEQLNSKVSDLNQIYFTRRKNEVCPSL